MLRNSLLAALVNYVRVVMQLPEYGCQFSCERFIYTCLEPLLNYQCCSSSGVVVTRTLERILLVLAVTEINTKKV